MNTLGVIVAAGTSSRLYPLTTELPKCLLEIGGRSLITRSVETILSHGVEEIYIVIGFEKEKIIEHLGSDFKFIENTDYKNNNNMASLGFAKPYVNGKPFVYLHSDLLFHPDIIKELEPTIEGNLHMVDRTSNDLEAMKVLVRDKIYLKSNKEIPIEESYGEWLGISKFSADTSEKLFKEIDAILTEGNFKCYDTSAFNGLAGKGIEMPIKDVHGLPWIEIDYPEDLQAAQNDVIKRIGTEHI